ncbi:MAG: restriction endonuclease subunit S [Methylobacter sp.]
MIQVIQIKEFGQIYTGKTPPTEDPNNFGVDYQFVTPGDLNDSKYINQTERYVSYQGIRYTTRIPENSICVACIGYIGKIGITTKECCTNQQINSIVVNDGYVIDYIYYILTYNVPYFKELAGVNVLPQLNKRDFSNVKLLGTKDKLEQKAIATVLSTVDETIAAVENSIKTLERLQKSLMQNLLTGKLKPDGTWRSDDEFYIDEKFGKVPIGWDVLYLKEIVSLYQYGLNLSSSDEGSIPMFRMNNIISGEMVDSPMVYVNLPKKEFEKYRLTKGDILFNRTNSLELVGKVGIFNLDGDFVFASYLIRLRVNEDNVSEYVNYYLNSYKGQTSLRAKATPAVSQANINAKSLIKTYLPTPSKPEQQEIVDIIKKHDVLIKSKHQKVGTLKNLKKSLMQNLLTGKKRIDLSRFEALITGDN